MANWSTDTKVRASDLLARMKTMGINDKDLAGVLTEELNRPPSHVPVWISDREVTTAWGTLHQAEEDLDDKTPDKEVAALLWDAAAHAERELSKSDRDLWKERMSSATDADARKLAAVQTIKAAHLAAELRHEAQRGWQRGMMVLSMASFASGLAVLVYARFSGTDSLLPIPGNVTTPAWQVLALVMSFGLVGGLLGALVKLYSAHLPTSTTAWWDPRSTVATTKAAVGMWTAWIGVAAVSSTAGGLYKSMWAVLLLAITFGFAQEVVTHYMDRKATQLLPESDETKPD